MVNQKRIDKLSKLIEKHNHDFHDGGKSTVTDAEYDSLVKELKSLTDAAPVLNKVGSQVTNGKTVKLTTPMLSLGNVFNSDEIDQWIATTIASSSDPNLDFVYEHKMDGIAVALTYKDLKLVRATTRGDGNEGEDITAAIRNIANIPQGVESPIGEVRGEVIITKQNFLQYNEALIAAGKKPMANPRNAVAGAIRRSVDKDAIRPVMSFYAYSIPHNLSTEPDTTQVMEMGYLRRIGFTTTDPKAFSPMPPYPLEVDRDKLEYEIDGLVIKVNSIMTQRHMGNKTTTPRWATAYKFPASGKTTILREVIDQVGRLGSLTPVAVFDPINLMGVTITRSTLHNYDEVIRLGLKIGDTILVERAGDVIPKVIKRIPELEPEDAQPIVPSTICPSCSSELVEKKDGYVCVNHANCRDQVVNSIVHYVSRAAVDIDGIGPSFIEKLWDLELLKDISDLYRIQYHREQLIALPGKDERSIDKILVNIEKSKNIPFRKFIHGLGIPFVGIGTAKRLYNSLGNMTTLTRASLEELMAIDDIGEKTANSIFNYFHNKDNLGHLYRIMSSGVTIIDRPTESADAPKPLKGENWVITGSLNELTRERATEYLTMLGAEVSGSVSKKTTHLLAGNNAGSKLKKAEGLDVVIMDEPKFTIYLAKMLVKS